MMVKEERNRPPCSGVGFWKMLRLGLVPMRVQVFVRAVPALDEDEALEERASKHRRALLVELQMNYQMLEKRQS